ncbi:hypothetical protein [Halioglobus maricola]
MASRGPRRLWNNSVSRLCQAHTPMGATVGTINTFSW